MELKGFKGIKAKIILPVCGGVSLGGDLRNAGLLAWLAYIVTHLLLVYLGT